MVLQETYVVEDCWKYDNALSDKTNSYTCNSNIALSHDTDHYIAVSSVSNNVTSNYYGLIDTGINYSDGIVIECDFKELTATNNIFGIFLGTNTGVATSNHSRVYQLSSFASSRGITTEPWAEKRTSGDLSTNTWYHFKLTISNGTGTGLIKQGDTTVFNDSLAYSYFSNLSKICLTASQRPQTVHFKNLKIKAL